MEYRQKIRTYSLILVVLGVVGVLGLFFSNQAVVARESQIPLLSGFDGAKATTIMADNGSPDGQVKLLKTDAVWKIHAGSQVLPANADRIEAFLKGLPKLTRFHKVATVNPNLTDSLVPYGLDKPKTLRIKDAQGRVLVDLDVGKTDETGTNVYVRLVGSSQVWLTNRNKLAFLDMGVNAWTDLRLLPGNLKPDDLVSVVFTGNISTLDKKHFGPFDLEKTIKDNKPQWELMPAKTFPSTAQGYIDGLSGFNVNSYLKPGETYDPESDTQGILTVTTQKGAKLVIHLGKEQKDGKIPASEGSRKFWLSSWSLEQILFSNQH